MAKLAVTPIRRCLCGQLSLALLALSLSACQHQRAFSIESTDGVPYYVVPVRAAPADSSEATLLQSTHGAFSEKSLNAEVPAAQPTLTQSALTQPTITKSNSGLAIATCPPDVPSSRLERSTQSNPQSPNIFNAPKVSSPAGPQLSSECSLQADCSAAIETAQQPSVLAEPAIAEPIVEVCQ